MNGPAAASAEPADGRVGLTPGAKEFIDAATTLKVAAVYISIRNTAAREQTKAALANPELPLDGEPDL